MFTNPRPETDNLLKYYESENYISHKDKPDNLIDKLYHLIRNHTLKRKYYLVRKYHFLTSINSHSPTILDIGCGTADFLNSFKNEGWKVYGVEPNNGARSIAKSRHNLDIDDNSALLKYPDNHFDVITMWHVLEHIPDLNSHISLIKRLLKPEGTLIVAVPNAQSPDAQHYKQYWAAFDVPRHLYHFNKKSIIEIFGKFDLLVADILPMKFDAFYISLLSEKNMTGKNNYLKAFFNGFISNLKATRMNNHSSLIFIIKNKISV
jgi:ubiquinone/menaquinone biosynthesis C-methylase UbiE